MMFISYTLSIYYFYRLFKDIKNKTNAEFKATEVLQLSFHSILFLYVFYLE